MGETGAVKMNEECSGRLCLVKCEAWWSTRVGCEDDNKESKSVKLSSPAYLWITLFRAYILDELRYIYYSKYKLPPGGAVFFTLVSSQDP